MSQDNQLTGPVPPIVAIVGSGNIGTDLMEKIRRSPHLELGYFVGVDPDSTGLRQAAAHGLNVSAGGVDWLLAQDPLPSLVFEATSAYVHHKNAPRYQQAGIQAVDLTPAAIGPFVVPPVNLRDHLAAPNVNMVTCGGQATVPMVSAVSSVTPVSYAEIVATIASRSAGPGTRANIDEFTVTTAKALEVVGGAGRGKAIIILNPAEPPLLMRDTIVCEVGTDIDEEAVTASVLAMEATVRTYVPGYRLLRDPVFDEGRVSIQVEVRGAGDFLPPYAGNLDIMTAAAVKIGEEIAVADPIGAM